ncbi:MAG: 50S ribosomal protein L25 [bacterium]|nr:50S ribosomal protein L25 [bacterium]
MELIAQKREDFGTKATVALRAEGLIPAELYGHGVANLHLKVKTKDFQKAFKEAGESTLITLVIDEEKRPVIITDVKTDPVKGNVIHADFYQVRLDEKIKAHVPIILLGVSAGVKEKGGILIHVMREIEVEALPADLPHDFKIDISGLDDINKSLHVSDLTALKGVEFMADPETVIATVSSHVEEVVEVAPVTVEDVKVEGEEKKKEKEATEAEEGKDSATEEKK